MNYTIFKEETLKFMKGMHAGDYAYRISRMPDGRESLFQRLQAEDSGLAFDIQRFYEEIWDDDGFYWASEISLCFLRAAILYAAGTEPDFNWDQIKDSVICRLVSREWMEHYSEFFICQDYLDIRMLLGIYYHNKAKDQRIFYPITKEQMHSWGCKDVKLIQLAMENTLRLLKPKAEMVTLDFCVKGDCPPELSGAIQTAFKKTGMLTPRLILSNNDSFCGANALCFPEFLDELSQELEDDLLLVPISAHQLVAEKMHGDIPNAKMQNALQAMNAETPYPEDTISSHIYCYRRAEKRLGICLGQL